MTTAMETVAPLDGPMLVMDVADTARHIQNGMDYEPDTTAREARLLGLLRDAYRQWGIGISDATLKDGMAALAENRLAYVSPPGGLGVMLARAYVSRRKWGRIVLAVVLALLIGLGGYYGIYKPYQASQKEQRRIEIAEALPAEMDRLYQAIFDETKVQQAVHDADELRHRGKAAAARGDRPAAEAAIGSLTSLRDTLRQDYRLKVVNRDGVKFGFWTFPASNSEATNYYVVVEAIDSAGKVLNLPILNEEDGRTETVALWGLRVPEAVYRALEADQRDNGIIEHNVVGMKQFGFIDVDYVVPVLGGAVTRW